MRNLVKFAGQALATFVLVAGAAVLLAGILVPRLTGADTYAVLAGSMAPRYPIGTLLVVHPKDVIRTGDVITFQLEPNNPTVVSHRVVNVGSTVGGEMRYRTKGDANSVADIGYVKPEQIRGVLWYAIPFAGYLVVALDGWREFASVIAATLLAFYALWQVLRSINETSKAKKAAQAVVEPAPVVEPGANAPAVETTSPPSSVVEPAQSATVETTIPPADSASFMPTMTRAERRRLQSLSSPSEPTYTLAS